MMTVPWIYSLLLTMAVRWSCQEVARCCFRVSPAITCWLKGSILDRGPGFPKPSTLNAKPQTPNPKP